MVNPLMFGLSPQQLQQAREAGNYVSARFVKRRAEGKFTVQFIPKRDGVELAPIVDKMVESMASQLYNFFGIGGEIEDAE